MLKTVAAAALVLLLGGCSASPAKQSANGFAPYKLQDASMSAFAGRKAYRIGTVKLALEQLRVNDAFPDQAALSALFEELLTAGLREKGLLAAADESALELHLDLRYKRVFMGELFGLNKGFAGSQFSWASELAQDGRSFAHYRSRELTVTSGIAGNLLTIGKQLTMTAGAADERAHVVAYVKAIVASIPH